VAAVDQGIERIATGRHSQRCEHTRDDGSGCGAWALRGGAYCKAHEDPLAWKEMAVRGGRNRAARARARKLPKPAEAFAPSVSRQRVIDVCADMLEAEVCGLEDWEARAMALLVLVYTFPERYRRTPTEARAALAAALPSHANEVLERAELTEQFRRLRWEYDTRAESDPFKRMHGDGYPDALIAPWEDAAKLNTERLKRFPAPSEPVTFDVRTSSPAA
jgi:hypothetical protein